MEHADIHLVLKQGRQTNQAFGEARVDTPDARHVRRRSVGVVGIRGCEQMRWRGEDWPNRSQTTVPQSQGSAWCAAQPTTIGSIA